MPVFDVIRNDSGYDRGDIQERHHGPAGLLSEQYFEKVLLECDAKGIEGDHVEQEVHEICMQGAMGDEPVPLSLFLHLIWPEQKILSHLFSVEGENGNDTGDNDDQECDAHG